MSTLVPGLVDIHVHGVKGLDVMAGQSNDIVRELRTLGVEYCCPTTVTASPQQTRQALAAIDALTPGFAGVHLEGPFISPARPGAQPAEQILEPSVDAFIELVGEFEHLIRIVTLAPERQGARELIEYLKGKGIVVSAGHTDATYDQLEENSPDHMTHFYNAMSPFRHREPGAVGFGLASPVACELIYDRIHVSRTAAQILWNAKKPSQIIGVSDGTMASGMADGWSGSMWGHEVTKRNGAVRLADGTLAGSAVALPNVFKFLWQDLGPEAAIAACSTNPRRALGLPEARMRLNVDGEGTIIEVLENP
ncbi:MAG: amidohydrolase family protein [Fimbriimonadales bacterium]